MKSTYDLIFIRDNGDSYYNLDYVSARTKKMTGFERVQMSPIFNPLNVLRSRIRGKIKIPSLRSRIRGKIKIPSLWINLVQCTDEAYPFIHRSEKGIYK